MREYDVKLTAEQIQILRAITRPRMATDPHNVYGDWSHDLDRRLADALADAERGEGP